MTIQNLQKRIGVRPDGTFGPVSRAAMLAFFTNPKPERVTSDQIAKIAVRLSCSPAQIRAVAAVESSGAAFDQRGRPKILFERHKFHAATGGKWSVKPFSNRVRGGYGEDSWGKLLDACACDPDAAFGSCSWGKFQVMGYHWAALKFASPFELAVSTVADEAGSYELLARYVEANKLTRALAKISTNLETCRAFAEGYNGSDYAAGGYHRKLAEAMQ
jgi:hypothetical protein